MTEKGIMIELA